MPNFARKRPKFALISLSGITTLQQKVIKKPCDNRGFQRAKFKTAFLKNN